MIINIKPEYLRSRIVYLLYVSKNKGLKGFKLKLLL